jgi:hypothetical protein
MKIGERQIGKCKKEAIMNPLLDISSSVYLVLMMMMG